VWFPETVLLEPLVVTDDHGDAVVSGRVPERMNTWSVIALAPLAGRRHRAERVASFWARCRPMSDPVSRRS